MAEEPMRSRHAHLYSTQRKVKYTWLNSHAVKNTKWTNLDPESPNYLFIPQNKALLSEYETRLENHRGNAREC